MSLWEYKVITSGKGGFATPALLEKFLNDLGRDEWEIVQFHTAPENFLAFTGLARRSTQRDWTLQDAAAAAAKAEAEKLRAEFEAKFKSANQSAAAPAEDRGPSLIEEKAGPDDGFRKPVDTSRDDEPEHVEEEKDEWDKLNQEDELPTFFEAIKPHMRRNQRGPGTSVGVDYLAKKWDQNEDDLKAALVECGFVMPEDEDSKAEYLEYDGDLYWLNINRRGELWINTKEKPRPVFRPVKGQKVVIEEEQKAPAEPRQPKQPKSESGEQPENDKPEGGESEQASAEGAEAKTEGGEKPEKSERAEKSEGGSKQPLPEGPELLNKIRPHMRRNRRGPGGSGSTQFLARALRAKEDDLKAAFVALGLTMPASANDKPVYTEVANQFWWLNLDSRGGLWINGRDKRKDETAATAAAAPEGAAVSEGAASGEAAPAAAPAEGAPVTEAPVGGEALAPAATTETTPAPAEVAPAAPAAAAEAAPTSVAGTEREREAAPMPAEVAPAAPAPAAEAAPAPASTEAPAAEAAVAEVGADAADKETKAEGSDATEGGDEGEKKPKRTRSRSKKAE